MEESTRENVEYDQSENKNNITAKVQKFIQDGCGCCRGLKGGQCSDDLTEESV